MMADRVGQQFGKYRLVRLLGKGGFAEVYLAEHLEDKTQVALKVLHAVLMSGDVERFRAEAQIIASLSHPHIVHLHDFDTEQGTPFLVMEYASTVPCANAIPGTLLSRWRWRWPMFGR
jgi:serine/threonine protein kinase